MKNDNAFGNIETVSDNKVRLVSIIIMQKNINVYNELAIQKAGDDIGEEK